MHIFLFDLMYGIKTSMAHFNQNPLQRGMAFEGFSSAAIT